MGAWGLSNFENDDAMDFVGDVTDNGKQEILKAIEKIAAAPQNEYLEAHSCCVALAAIEYIAAAKENAAEDFPEEAAEWLAENELLPFKIKGIFGLGSKEINITAISLQAIEKIKTRSELLELWQDAGDDTAWLNMVNDLKDRIA